MKHQDLQNPLFVKFDSISIFAFYDLDFLSMKGKVTNSMCLDSWERKIYN